MTEKPIAKTEEGNDVRALISSEAYKKEFQMALPKHITPDRFIRIALTALTKNPKLLKCTKQSLFSCLLDCSSMGIEPDGRKAHLIPFENRKTGQTICTLIVDYKGLVDITRRSGEIGDIHADVVCENDKFEYSHGTNSKLIHVPALTNRGKAIAAYSFVTLKDGSTTFEIMNVEDVEKIHVRSKAANSGPWVTDWQEMAKKTAFRRHSKWLPVSNERLNIAMEKDYDKFPEMENIIAAPMIGLRNDKANKQQPVIDVEAGPAEKQETERKAFAPSPSDLTKTSETVMKREIMVMIIAMAGDDRTHIENALLAYTTHMNQTGTKVLGIRDINDILFKGEWVQGTHEKLARAYLEKTGKK